MLFNVLFTHDVNSPDKNGIIWISNMKLTSISTKQSFDVGCSTSQGMLYMYTYDAIFYTIYNLLDQVKDSVQLLEKPMSKEEETETKETKEIESKCSDKKDTALWFSSLSIYDVDGKPITPNNYYKITNFKTEYYVRTHSNKSGVPFYYAKYFTTQIPRFFYNKYTLNISEEELRTQSLQRITAYVIRTAYIHMRNMPIHNDYDETQSDDSIKDLIDSKLNFSDINISNMFSFDVSEYVNENTEQKDLKIKPKRVLSMPNIKLLETIPEEDTENNIPTIMLHKTIDDSVIDESDEVTL